MLEVFLRLMAGGLKKAAEGLPCDYLYGNEWCEKQIIGQYVVSGFTLELERLCYSVTLWHCCL